MMRTRTIPDECTPRGAKSRVMPRNVFLQRTRRYFATFFPKPREGVRMGPRLLLAVFLSSCATDPAHRPTLDPVTEKIAVRDFAGTTIDFDLNVTNPSKRPVAVQGYVYKFLVAGRAFKEDRVATKSNVPAGEQWQRTLSLPVRLGELDGFLRRRQQQNATVRYELYGSVHLVDRSGNHRLPFRVTGEIALLRKPQFELENMRIENLSADGARILFDLTIKNSNVFTSRFEKASADLILEGQTFAQQLDVTIPSLGPGATARVPMLLNPRFANLGTNSRFIL